MSLSVDDLIGIGLKLGPRLKLLKFIEHQKEKKSDPVQNPVAAVTFVSGYQIIASRELPDVHEITAADILSIDTEGPPEKGYTVSPDNENGMLSPELEKGPEIGSEVETANPITVTNNQTVSFHLLGYIFSE